MRKTGKLAIAIVLAILLSAVNLISGLHSPTVLASSHEIIVVVDGKRIQTNHHPYLYQYRTYVPVREYTTATGGLLQWDPSSRQITIRYEDRTLVHVIGQQTMRVNGQMVKLSAPSRLTHYTTYLPLRDMAEAIDAKITVWNETNRKIIEIDTPSYTAAKVQESMREIDDYLRKQRFVGTALVARNGEILLEKGYGPNGLGGLNKAENRTRIASISKQFTRAAILKLQEDGKLEVSQTLSTYIPDFPRGEEITVQMLLSHHAGLASNFPRVKGETLDQTVEKIKKMDFAHSPAEKKYKYSNPGFVLLAKVIELASGMTYGEYINTQFIAPLGLEHTGEYTDGQQTIQGLLLNNGKYAAAPYYNSQSGTGSLYSNVYDLYRWHEALFSGQVLKPESVKQMFPPYFTVGSGSGYSTVIVREPDTDTSVILLSNQGGVVIYDLYKGVRERLK